MILNGFDFNTLAVFADKVLGFMGKPDPKEYAIAVKELHTSGDVHKTLENRIEAIEKDPELSRDEKEALKSKITAQYLDEDLKHIQGCADVVDREAFNRGELAKTVFWGTIATVAAYGAVNGVANGIQNWGGQLHIEPRSGR